MTDQNVQLDATTIAQALAGIDPERRRFLERLVATSTTGPVVTSGPRPLHLAAS